MDGPRLIPIGRVVKTHGVRGALKVSPYGETLGELEAGEKLWFLESGGGERRQVTLAEIRDGGKALIVRFEEIGDMDRARDLAGKKLFIDEGRLPALPEGEYYHYQLIGLSVLTRDGKDLGTVRAIMETGSNDVYVVESDGGEMLLPAIEDVICEVDIEARKITVDLPEGLE
jgi:16S rRNA processing protein RimM